MNFNILEFEKVIKASNESDKSIDKKVEEYRKSLLEKAKDLEDKKEAQVKTIMKFLSDIEIGDANGGYIRDYDDGPDSISVGKDYTGFECITLEWNPTSCQMGTTPGTSITIYYKAFAIPTEDLRKMLEVTNSIKGVIEVDEVDAY